MIRRSFGLLGILAFVILATLMSSATASAQDAPEYPGPFNEEETTEETEAVATVTDEVLGQTLEAETDTASTTEVPEHERSIDYIGGDTADMFVAPDIQPGAVVADSVDAVGGTGGGLAVTGSDVEPILAISVGLLAVGGSALVSSRRRLRDFFN